LNLFSKFKTDTQINFWSAWVQGVLTEKDWQLTSRVEKKKNNHFNLNEKFYFHKDKIHFWAAAKVDLNAQALVRYNALFAYKEKDFDVLLQHESLNKAKIDLGKLHLSGYYRHGKYQAGLKTSFLHTETGLENQLDVTLGGIAKVDDKNVAKAKIDKDANLSLSWKHTCTKHITATVSTGINLKDTGSFVKDTIIPVPVGFQFEFTY